MSFVFNIHKTVESLAYIITNLGMKKTTTKYDALKYLYFADRLALKRGLRLITGDTPYAMEYGPILSNTYDLIKNNVKRCDSKNLKIWIEHFKLNGNHINLIKNPGIKYLSRFDISILDEIIKDFSDMDFNQLKNISHQLKEWNDAYKKIENTGKKSIPIGIENILKTIGEGGEINYVQEKIEEEKFLSQFAAQGL